MSETIFGKIIAGEIDVTKVYEDDLCIAINDISPQAPTHVLIIPKQSIDRVANAKEADKGVLGHLMWAAGEVARKLGVEEAFRLVVNNGEGAGQTVFHLHIHLLAGKNFEEQGL